jgi:hypothetical protein
MHVVQLLGLLIPGLEIAVAQRPGGRNAIAVGELLEIALAQAEMVGAIHLGGPTHEVMAAGLEGLAVAVEPGVLGEVAALLEHLLRIPVLGLLG